MAAEITRDMKPLTRNYHLYRGEKRSLDYKVGEIADEKGFASTSTDPSVSAGFSEGRTMYQLVGPKGMRAILENGREAEVTLPPKRQFRVLERYRNVSVGSRKVENYYVVELLED